MLPKLLTASLSLLLLNLTAAAQAVANQQIEQRADQLLSQLTQDEKLDLLGGIKSFYTKPIARLSIPSLKMTDGPVGTRNDGPSTAYPAGVLLASTWDIELARREGVCLARNGLARGDHIILGPGVNIYRVPQNGRNFEYFGEDPFLAGQIDVAFINGMQSQGVAACVKHYACNNQETGRNSIDTIVDERTLHEIYLPAFEAAVRQAHVRAVMAAYNRVNGSFMTANDYLINQVLKKEWGFDGILMSDWGATHDALAAANGGLDLEMPSGEYFNPRDLEPLIDSKQVSQAVIDDKVRRILRVMLQMNWMNHTQKDADIPLDDPQSNQTALDAAREGITLLKNQGNLLPLDRSKYHTIAVISPNGDQFITGGGSSRTVPFHFILLADGLSSVAGSGVKIVPVPWVNPIGDDMPGYAKASKFDGPGLRAAFFNSEDLSGTPAVSRIDPFIQYNWHHNLPMPEITTHSFSARWTGRIHAAATGPYAFAVRSDDGSRIILDGKTILDDWSDHPARTRSTTVNLTAQEPHDLVVEYYNAVGSASIDFGWGAVQPLLSDQSRAVLASADAVVLSVATHDGEGADRDYSLSAEQNELIQTVASLNRKTILVLESGGNVAMSGWIDHIPALLDAWYPGQGGGQAIAEILFGDVNPSGHLPDTFEKDWPDSPAFGHYPGQKGSVEYSEGIYVGYRWYDKKKIEPRFPFGFGLSYTTFALSNLKVASAGSGDARTFVASVDVTNTGSRPGAEVVQLYVRPPQSDVDRPVQELKAFNRIQLAPGATASVRLPLDFRSFAYWDIASHDWRVIPGEYEIAVGDSSRNILQTARITW
jgi:beta-glucosidase